MINRSTQSNNIYVDKDTKAKFKKTSYLVWGSSTLQKTWYSWLHTQKELSLETKDLQYINPSCLEMYKVNP